MPGEIKNNSTLELTPMKPSEMNYSPLLRLNSNGDILYASPGCTHLLACWNSTIGKSLPDELLTAVRHVQASNLASEVKVKCNESSYTFCLTPSQQDNYVDLSSIDLALSKEAQILEFQKQNKQLNRITQVSSEILALCDVDNLLNKIVVNGIKLLDGSAGGIYIYNSQKEKLIWKTGIGEFDFQTARIEKGMHFCGRVWQAGKAIVEQNYSECRVVDSPNETRQAIIGAPLYLEEEFFGVLCICRCHENAEFSSNDLELFERYTSLAAITLKNARFYEKAQKEIKKREQAEKIKTVLFRISEAAGSTLSLKEMLAQIHEYVGRLIDTSNFYIALYEPEIQRYFFPYIVDEEEENHEFAKLDLSKSLTDYVRRTGEPLFVDTKKDEELRLAGEVELVGSACPVWMGAPLKTEHGTIGVVVVQHYHDENAYTRKDLQILSFVSDNIARAIMRKRAQESITNSLREKEFLLQEIHHRVKNNLQIISSLLYLQSKKVSKELVSHFEDSQNRIKTMALIHENLYRSEDFANINFNSYVKSLTNKLIESNKMLGKGISLDLDIASISVPIQFAVPCGLVINELVTNALKYGFPDRRDGLITIILKTEEAEPGTNRQKIHLVVKDNGVGLPDDFNLQTSGSLGLQLVQSLISQLDGDFDVCTEQGTCFKINMFAS